MKKVSVLVLFSYFLCSCGGNTNSKPETLSGVYTLKNTIAKGDADQSGTQETAHFKIYTPSNYFIASIQNDSSVRFGVGFYEIVNDTIIERNFYNTENFAEKNEMKLIFSKSENGFTQIASAINNDVTGASIKLEYDTISINGAATNADGLWQHVRTMKVNGTDTSYLNFAGYFIFHAGHYLKASRVVIDSAANQYKSDFYFGNFTLNNKSLTENCTFSSDPKLSGSKSSSNLVINEKDGTMLQINTASPGGATEYVAYRRVK